MSRQRSILVSRLNVVATPHPIGIYETLLMNSRGVRAHSRGGEFATIGSASRNTKDDTIIGGQLFFYTELERGGDWFDLVRREVATDEDKGQINIPEHLRPNASECRFAFDATKHIMYFEQKSANGRQFSNAKVRKVIENILNNVDIVDRPNVVVTIIPTEDAFEFVLGVPNLNKLVIRLERPNADDIGDAKDRLMAKLANQSASRVDVELTKAKGALSLVPDEETRELAAVASENGYVRSRGSDIHGQRVDRQTSQYPATDRISLTESEDPLDALYAFIHANRN